MLKEYFLTNLQGFDLHIAGGGGGGVGVYCKPCLHPNSCSSKFILHHISNCHVADPFKPLLAHRSRRLTR